MSASPRRRKWRSEGSGRWLHGPAPGLPHQILSYKNKQKKRVRQHQRLVINAFSGEERPAQGERERKKRCLLKLWKCSIVNDSSDVESEHHRGTASSLFHNIEHLRKHCQSHHILFYCTRFNGGLLVDNIALMHHEEKELLLAWGANGRIDLTLIKESVWTTVAVLVCGFYCTVVQVFAVSLFALGTQTLDL